MTVRFPDEDRESKWQDGRKVNEEDEGFKKRGLRNYKFLIKLRADTWDTWETNGMVF